MTQIYKYWPFFCIFLIWFVFASPYFLKGRVPYPASYQINNYAPWSAYSQFASPVKNGAMPDVVTQIYPWKHYTIESLKNGQIPFWNPYSFSGTPHLANYQSAVLTPLNLLFFILPFNDAWSMVILLQPLIAAIFMYIYARSISISKVGALLSTISFMFCGFVVTWMGYGTLVYAIVFLPLALYSIEEYIHSQKSRYLFILFISIPLSFFSGHFQISLYFLLFLLLYLLYTFMITKDFKKSSEMALTILSGLSVSMVQVLPSLEFYSQSVRSGIFQRMEAIPLAYIPTFLAPDFFGNPVTRNDWFGHYAEWNGYIGIVPYLFAWFAVVTVRNKRTFFFFISAILVLLLAFSTPVLDLLISLHIPVLSTSAASRIIILYCFLFSVLAGIGIDSFWTLVINVRFKSIALWIGSFIVLFLILWGIVLFKAFLPLDKIIIARQNLYLPSFLFFLVIVVIGVGVSIRKRKITFTGILFALLVIAAFDMVRFADKWQTFEPKKLIYPSADITSVLPTLAGYDRAYGNYSADTSHYYHLPSVEGYDPLYIRKYGEFITAVNTGQIGEAYRSVVTFPKNGLYTPQAINLLDIKFFIQKRSDDERPWSFPFSKYPRNQFTTLYADNVYRILRNNTALPRVFLTGNYTVVSDEQSVVRELFGHGSNRLGRVILREEPHLKESSNSFGFANIVSYTPDKVSISTETENRKILFFSDAYYPGWHATVDGNDTHIFQADFAFKAVEVPKGKHTVIFYFLPGTFITGCAAAVIGVLVLLFVTLKPGVSTRILKRTILTFGARKRTGR